jgi:hypothetical protein
MVGGLSRTQGSRRVSYCNPDDPDHQDPSDSSDAPPTPPAAPTLGATHRRAVSSSSAVGAPPRPRTSTAGGSNISRKSLTSPTQAGRRLSRLSIARSLSASSGNSNSNSNSNGEGSGAAGVASPFPPPPPQLQYHQHESKWDEGVSVIQSLLQPGSATYQAMTVEQRQGLKQVEILLLDGIVTGAGSSSSASVTAHIPTELIRMEHESTNKENSSYKYLMKEFGGVQESTAIRKVRTALIAHAWAKHAMDRSTRKMQYLTTHRSNSTTTMGDSSASLESDEQPEGMDPNAPFITTLYTPPEFSCLDIDSRRKMYQDYLHWDQLKQWDYNIFELSKLSNGHPLLLIGWALFASPHAQQAMKASCGIQQEAQEVEISSNDDKKEDGTILPELQQPRSVKVSKSMDLDEVTTDATSAPPTACATPASSSSSSSSSSSDGGYNFCETFKIPQDTLCEFLRAMENEYNSENPYHNEIHGADVVQTAHALLQMNKAVTTAAPPPPPAETTTTTVTTNTPMEEEEENGGNTNGALPPPPPPPPPLSPAYESTDEVVVEEELLQLTDLERFAYLLAAVVHDVGHPGRNNSFQINRQTVLALEYNDLSVLENMHASKAFRRLFQVTDVALPTSTTTPTKTTAGRRVSQLAPLSSPTSRMSSGKGATFASRAASMGDIGIADNSSSSVGPVLEGIPVGAPGSPKSSFHEPYNILRNMDPESVTKVRKMTIEAVLHTDMSKHFVTVSKMKGLILSTVQQQLQQEQQQQQNQNSETRKSDTDDAALSTVGGSATPPQYIASLLGDGNPWQVLCFMLHLADISNPAKPQPMLTEWTDRCLEEFFAQGDEEAKLGLTISPNCNRKSTHRADSQIGFIKFVILPAYEVLAELIPDVGDEVLPIIEANLLYWTDFKTREDNSVAIKAAAARAELAIIEKGRTPQILQRKQQLEERASIIQAHAMENNPKGGEGQSAAVAATASDFLSKFKRSKAPAPSTS